MVPLTIRPLRRGDAAEALRMLRALWPGASEREHRASIEGSLEDRGRTSLLVAERDEGGLCGFVELGVRSYADGCRVPSPVGVAYLEGWWVDPDCRRAGVGRALVEAGESWGRERGCAEMASDAELGNELSRLAHVALGFEETDRVMQFRKALSPAAPATIHASPTEPLPQGLAARGRITDGIPAALPSEHVALLAVGGGVRVERIVSRGHVSPPGFWYDPDEDEWVMLVAGAARLEIEGEGEIELRPGDWIDLRRSQRHRVSFTDPERDTIWLAVFRR